MPQITVSPPPLRQQLVWSDSPFIARGWSSWFSNLFAALGGSINVGTFYMTAYISDLHTASTTYIPIPASCGLIQVQCVVQGTVTGANQVIHILQQGGGIMATLIVGIGSPAGTVATINPTINNAFGLNNAVGIQVVSSLSSANAGLFLLQFAY